MSDLWRLPATELAAGIRNREYTAVEVLDSVLARVDEHNPRLNAITYDCSDAARAEAEAADAALAAGDAVGALHGVPVTIKENVDQAGTPNTNGIPALADLMADEDCPLVSNLRGAGVVEVQRVVRHAATLSAPEPQHAIYISLRLGDHVHRPLQRHHHS